MNMLTPRNPADLDRRVEEQDIKKLKVASIEPFGLFLEDGGFIHVCKISAFHIGTAFQPKEINAWYPVGSAVFVKLEKKEKLINGSENIFYDFLGPADVINTIGTPQNSRELTDKPIVDAPENPQDHQILTEEAATTSITTFARAALSKVKNK
jgi:hypothetical protein